MCTILLRWAPGAATPIMLAANRDEYRERLADAPGEIAPGVFAGRDRTAGGTWLAVSLRGVAALTNVRGGRRDPDAPSRGALPLAALDGRLPADLTPYNGFNLLIVDRDGARVVSHDGASGAVATTTLAPGSHAIDNELFGRPSPRTARVATAMAAAPPDLAMLGDHGASPEDGLCHHGEVYGTVSATFVAIDASGRVQRYLHAGGPPCRNLAVDLTAAARRVTGSRQGLAPT